MSRVLAGITISVDGFITGPDDGPGCGLGVGGERLHLRRRHDRRLRIQTTAEIRQFAGDRFEVQHWIGTPTRVRNIHKVHQHPRALDVTQKLCA